MVRASVLSGVIILILIPLLMTGCGPMETSYEPSSQPTSTPQQVSVDASFSGKDVVLSVNAILVVTLESNATTGFRWELVSIDDPSILKLVESNYQTTQTPGESEPLVGAGGKEIWIFRALKPGQTNFNMAYIRSGQTVTSNIKTFQLTAIVK